MSVVINPQELRSRPENHGLIYRKSTVARIAPRAMREPASRVILHAEEKNPAREENRAGQKVIGG
jgi:hypothetical protein